MSDTSRKPIVERLDEDHVLESVPADADEPIGDGPLVRDARGGLWRVRRVRRDGGVDWWSAGSLAVVAILAVVLAIAVLGL